MQQPPSILPETKRRHEPSNAVEPSSWGGVRATTYLEERRRRREIQGHRRVPQGLQAAAGDGWVSSRHQGWCIRRVPWEDAGYPSPLQHLSPTQETRG